jgi:hypothetical protein
MVTYRPTYTSIAQSSGTTLTLTKPADVEAGDWLLAGLQVAGGTGVTITPHSDWELVRRQDDSTDESLAVYRHRVTASSPASWAFTLTSAAVVAVVIAYGGADQFESVDVSASQANASATSCVAPAATSTKTDALIVGFFGAATGARTATPPTGMTERADVQGAALALSVADVKQRTLGSSGTKTATLSGASKNIGMLIALCPAALNTPSDALDEGNWSLAGWQTRFTTAAALSAFVERQIQFAAADLWTGLPDGFYPARVTRSPWLSLLTKAEMHLTQALLLECAAAITETSDDDAPAPFFGTADAIRKAAQSKRDEADRLTALMLAKAGISRKGPVFVTATTTGAMMETLDPVTGDDGDPFDDA